MERHRRPPDVEEALSSMLWTPYQRSPSDSSDEEEEQVNDCNLRTHHHKNNNKSSSKLKSKITATDLYAITDQHLYAKPVRRYREGNFASNYGYFVPKTYNSLHSELPSYDHIEKERNFGNYFFADFNTNRVNNNSNNIVADNANNNNGIYHNNNNNNSIGHSGCSSSNIANNNNANCPSNGIYMIHEHSKCPTSMVHSFTDDFLQYQVNKSCCFHACSLLNFYFLPNYISLYVRSNDDDDDTAAIHFRREMTLPCMFCAALCVVLCYHIYALAL